MFLFSRITDLELWRRRRESILTPKSFTPGSCQSRRARQDACETILAPQLDPRGLYAR
jgi:hypothetical protein